MSRNNSINTLESSRLDKVESNKMIHKGTQILETPKEYKERWWSVRVIYFTVFIMSLGFSIVLTGVWPYLNKLDKRLSKEFMGWVVAANPFAQMLFSPVVGWVANKLGSVRLTFLVSLGVFIFASSIYSTLEIFMDYRGYWMLFSRFLIGGSGSCISLCRSYVSAATKLEERTKAMSMISLAQVVGFIFGPVLQAAVTPLGDEGYIIWKGGLVLDMYTASGWLSVLLGIINLIFLLPYFFKEKTIAAKEAMLRSGALTEKAAWKELKLDYLSSWILIWGFFIFSFNFVLLETLAAPLTMDQFGWSKEEALYYLGIMMSVGGVIGCVTVFCLPPLCKKCGEFNILMVGGFLTLVIGCICLIPWGTPPPPIAYPERVGPNGTNSTLGCPSIQEWCFYTPAMTVTQLLVGFVFVSFGYPIGLSLIQALLSKVLGPRPQGLWMGLMTGAGCLSRVLGPIFVSTIYTRLGPIWMFGLTVGVTLVGMLCLQGVAKRIKARSVSFDKNNQTRSIAVELKELAPT